MQSDFKGTGNSPEGENRPIQPRLVAVKTSIKSVLSGNYFQHTGKWEPDYVVTPEGEKVSRINLIGAVVSAYFSEDGNYGAVTLDDGTETIRLKAFKGEIKPLQDLKIGSIVNVIGRLRKYKDELYIAPETIIPSDTQRELLRRLEIEKSKRKLAKLKSLVVENSAEFDEPQKLIDFLSNKYGFSKSAVEAVLLSDTPKSPSLESGQEGGEGSSSGEGEGEEESVPKANPNLKASVLGAIEKAGSQGIDYSAILRETSLSAGEADPAIKELISEGEIFEPRSGKFKRLV